MSDAEQSTPRQHDESEYLHAFLEGLKAQVVSEMQADLAENPSRITLPYLRERIARWIVVFGGEAPPPEIVQSPSEATLREISRELGPQLLDRRSLEIAHSELQSILLLFGELGCSPIPLMGETVRHLGNAMESIAEMFHALPPAEVPHGA